MRSVRFILSLTWALVLQVSAANAGFDVISVTPGSATTANATYRCTLTNEWTAKRHPVDYPKHPQLSSPLIVSHARRYRLWAPNVQTTISLQAYIESGSPDALLFALISSSQVRDVQVASTLNVSTVTQRTLPAIRVDRQHSYITTTVPFQPSPDWFSGFYTFNTIDSKTNKFLKAFTIAVYPWDGGSRTGTTYTSVGSPIKPAHAVSEITVKTVAGSKVFLNPQRTGILPVASWSCQQ